MAPSSRRERILALSAQIVALREQLRAKEDELDSLLPPDDASPPVTAPRSTPEAHAAPPSTSVTPAVMSIVPLPARVVAFAMRDPTRLYQYEDFDVLRGTSSPQTLRSAISRAIEAGKLESPERGRYRVARKFLRATTISETPEGDADATTEK
jgi:hypothetical protein